MIDDIITDVLKAEGWDKYTNDPADRGGPTKWGITQKAWAEWRLHDVTPEDIQNITEAQARDFYEEAYVISPQFHLLGDRLIALVVDCGVNHGVRAAAKWVQRAVGARQDGIIGTKTIEAVQGRNPIATYLRVTAYRLRLYGRLVSGDKQLKAAQDAGFKLQAKFGAGWSNRGTSFLLLLADSLD